MQDRTGCLQTNIPQVDNTALECDLLVSDICVILSTAYPLIGTMTGDTLLDFHNSLNTAIKNLQVQDQVVLNILNSKVTITDNEDGTYTFTDGDGNQTVIDTNTLVSCGNALSISLGNVVYNVSSPTSCSLDILVNVESTAIAPTIVLPSTAMIAGREVEKITVKIQDLDNSQVVFGTTLPSPVRVIVNSNGFIDNSLTYQIDYVGGAATFTRYNLTPSNLYWVTSKV